MWYLGLLHQVFFFSFLIFKNQYGSIYRLLSNLAQYRSEHNHLHHINRWSQQCTAERKSERESWYIFGGEEGDRSRWASLRLLWNWNRTMMAESEELVLLFSLINVPLHHLVLISVPFSSIFFWPTLPCPNYIICLSFMWLKKSIYNITQLQFTLC